MDEATPELDPPEGRRCAVCSERASYGFSPPEFPLQPVEAWYLRHPSARGRANLGGALSPAR